MTTLKAGDLVKIVNVIATNDATRNDEKKQMIGRIYRICKVLVSNLRHADQVYDLFSSPYHFHADELEKVELPTMQLPQQGDVVELIAKNGVFKVDSVTISVKCTDENGNVAHGELFRILDAKEQKAHKKQALAKKHAEMLEEANAAVSAASKIYKEMAQIQAEIASLDES